ncbi:predicted protein [Nematostella vectensis]|uniref:Endonuclease/exonuclease/phosphatase domain-containing protein n=1 Tax=Nematostella vectensis TaxID=45351 RepID=A7SE82_NEMVE|nr:predicted protein [Nematostella vectensis]|eukprot:XP_001630025.1 predicted protein [Nematostella vectensis]
MDVEWNPGPDNLDHCPVRRKYRRCRAGKKVKERLNSKVYKIPVVISNWSRNGCHERKTTRTQTLSLIKPSSGPTARRIVPKCMVLNARSLAKPDAAPALYAELSSNKIDICFVSKSWLNKKILSHLICPDGYVMVRKDRADLRAGGGVAIICRNYWKIKVLNVAASFESETVWCIITTPNSEFYAASIYHPPNPVYDAAELLDFMSDTCDQILLENPNAKIIIAGDINQLNIITVPPLAPVKPSRKYVSLRDTRDHRKVAMDSKLEISKLKWAKDFNFENPEECVRTLNDRL